MICLKGCSALTEDLSKKVKTSLVFDQKNANNKLKDLIFSLKCNGVKHQLNKKLNKKLNKYLN